MDNFPWLTAMMVVPLIGAALIAALPSAMAARAKELALAVCAVPTLSQPAAAGYARLLRRHATPPLRPRSRTAPV